MTLAIGRRVIIVEGVERWRQADVETAPAAGAFAQMPPETTLALFAREEARAKAPAALHDGGQARRRPGRRADDGQAVGARQVGARAGGAARHLARRRRREGARRAGRRAPAAAAARAREARARRRRRRAERRISVGVEDIESRAAHSTEWRAYGAGRRARRRRTAARRRSPTCACASRASASSGLTYLMAQRLRDALARRAAPAGGRVASPRSSAACACPRALPSASSPTSPAPTPSGCAPRSRALADLELDSRGGAPLASSRTALAGLDEDTLALRAIEAITA